MPGNGHQPANDQPLNLNLGRGLAQMNHGVPPQSAARGQIYEDRNPEGHTVSRGNLDQFSPRSGNSGLVQNPLTSDDDMGNLDEGYDQPPPQYKNQIPES